MGIHAKEGFILTYRSLSAIVFAVIIVIELVVFMNLDAPKIRSDRETTGSGLSGFVSQFEVDHEAQTNQNEKYMILIGTTLIVGGIVTFAMPNKKINK